MSEERGGWGAVWIAVIIGLLAVSVLGRPTSAASQPNPCPLDSGIVVSQETRAMSLENPLPRPLNPCPGFEWARTFGISGLHDHAWAVDITADGGAVILVSTSSRGPNVVKVDGEGAVQWQRVYYVPFAPMGSGGGGLQQTSDGGFVLAVPGNVGNPATIGIIVLKLDPVGGVLWQTAIDGPGSDYVFSIAEVPTGGYVVGGETNSFGAGERDLWIIRLDASGGVLWQRTYGGPGQDLSRGVLPTSDGGFVAAGYGQGAYVLKTDDSGNVIWQKLYRATLTDLSSIQTTSDGGYIFNGKINGKWTVVKLTSSGSIAWQRTYGNAQWYGSIAETADGGYVASMNVQDADRGLEFALLRLDASGNKIWQRSYGGPLYDEVCYPYCVQEAQDGNILLAGFTESFGTGGGSGWTNMDAWVLRVFSDGSISSTCDPSFGASLRAPPVGASKLKAQNLAFTSSPSSGLTLDPAMTSDVSSLVAVTQCMA